jgi:hypothetical protein
MPLILATQEAKTGGYDLRLAWEKVSNILSQKQPSMVASTCNPSYLGDRGRKIVVRGWQGKSMRPYLKK